ncbi:hypothetical protein KP79_PYT22517 [Mizuhopecten yessoensis]|uniref:ZP domain-containing protein n=1 Tax=Mizuhopecten yessoensis TaxID=6573 RepID=A0A210QM06_MIZYE|nr:hypothetical protein KP79_PYT22517 [Mizuhopecten yessoensis]
MFLKDSLPRHRHMRTGGLERRRLKQKVETCLPDGIVHIHGIPKGYTVTSLIGGSRCHVTQIDAHDFALGQYCTQWVYHNYPYYKSMYQADIQLGHSSSHVVGGSDFSPFRLICDKVHSGGQVFDVVTSLNVRDRSTYFSDFIPTLPSARKSESNRIYQTSPQLFISSTYPYYYYSGSLFYLQLQSGSSHYAIRPENCTASANDPRYYYTSGDSVELWDITKDRCVLEPYLMEKFISSNADQTEVAAPVYAFHFGTRGNYDHTVYFECSVRVCSRGSFSCSLNVCDDVRREGRSAEEEEDDDYEHHLVTGTLTLEHNASGSDRGRFSLFTTLLGVVAVVLCW